MERIILRPTDKAPSSSDKADTHTVLLRLEEEDHAKLVTLCRLGETNRNDILRQCIRHVYAAEFATKT